VGQLELRNEQRERGALEKQRLHFGSYMPSSHSDPIQSLQSDFILGSQRATDILAALGEFAHIMGFL